MTDTIAGINDAVIKEKKKKRKKRTKKKKKRTKRTKKKSENYFKYDNDNEKNIVDK